MGHSTSFCGVVDHSLPPFCTCTDAQYGGVLDCNVVIAYSNLSLGTIEVKLDIEPFADPLAFSFEVTEATGGVD